MNFFFKCFQIVYLLNINLCELLTVCHNVSKIIFKNERKKMYRLVLRNMSPITAEI